MDSKFDHVNKQLEYYKKNNIYRKLLISQLKENNEFYIGNKKVINLCSNDYLGLSQNKVLIEQTKRSLRQISQCSSRLVSGNDVAISKLEKILASHRGSESALVFPTGYMANLGAISAISTEEHTIFSDELNHASIIDACKLAKKKKVAIFNHNDADDLEKKIKKTQGKTIVITEGVFSMDGDIAKLDEICEITKKYDSILVVDDAHGDFIFGKEENYGGVPEKFGVEDNVDIHVSSLSKGLGCFGGYTATSQIVNELFINKSRPFIYTSAIPEHICISAINAISFLNKKSEIQSNFYEKIKWFNNQLKKIGFDIGPTSSQIIPIIIGEEKLTLRFSKNLFDFGIFIQAIRYPTVELGKSRLRISLNSSIRKNILEYVIICLEKLGKKYDII